MSEIDLDYILPMESHLTRISQQFIKLNEENDRNNTKHFERLCKYFTDEMREDEVFKKLFKRVELAGSYPDKIKISEPDEYDALMILNFPNSRPADSRPGYVTINIKDAIEREWRIGDMFVDDKGYLIQNKVLNWLRDLFRSTLQADNNPIIEETEYEIIQSSNGPAVTLDVTTVSSSDTGKFSIDFVAALSFHSDEWWMSDRERVSGIWNAIPKPIKFNVNAKSVNLDTDVRNRKSVKTSVNGKVKTPPAYIRYRKPKKPNVVNGEAEIAAASVWHKKLKNPSVNVKVKTSTADMRYEKLKNTNVNYKAPIPVAGIRYNNRIDSDVNGKTEISHSGVTHKKIKKPDNTRKAEIQAFDISCNKGKEPNVSENVKIAAFGNRYTKSKDRSVNGKIENVTKRIWYRKQKKSVNPKTPPTKNPNLIPNPSKNREWICSYAQIEREFLKGTNNMKPLIRIFKKIRDNKQLTNMKSYFIKTIFLHQFIQNSSDYWQQSLSVLFMKMFNVILEHLCGHELKSFWHSDFNLIQQLRPGQINAIHSQLLKIKKDIEENLLDDNSEFISEVICAENELLVLDSK